MYPTDNVLVCVPLIWTPPPTALTLPAHRISLPLFIIIATTLNNTQILRPLAHCKRLFEHNRLVLTSLILAVNSCSNGYFRITAGVT
jgi:hypothetical protein